MGRIFAELSEAGGRAPAAGEDGARFPLALCLAGLAVNGLGLSAALLGVQWGAREPAPDALRLAWLYVNLTGGANWFLLWPAGALRGRAGRGGGGVAQRNDAGLLWDLATLIIAALPALAAGAWVSEATWAMIGRMAALQAALGLFAWGVLSWRNGAARREAILAGALAALFVALPLLAYVQTDYLPMLAGGWQRVAPALAIHAAAAPAGDAWNAWVTAAYALAGAACLGLRWVKRR